MLQRTAAYDYSTIDEGKAQKCDFLATVLAIARLRRHN
jgi:hypothetical protein